MRNKSALLVLALGLLWVAPLFAKTKSFMTSESAKNVFRQDETNRTPRERIRLSEQKVRENPLLRGRWNHKSHELASEGSTVNDNLTEKILSNFRQDQVLAKIPAKLKVSSSRGVVTLDGVINNADEKALIEGKVSQMDGVKKVENHLKIKTSDKDLLD